MQKEGIPKRLTWDAPPCGNRWLHLCRMERQQVDSAPKSSEKLWIERGWVGKIGWYGTLANVNGTWGKTQVVAKGMGEKCRFKARICGRITPVQLFPALSICSFFSPA